MTKSKSFPATNNCASILAAVALCLSSLSVQTSHAAPAFRPPAVPLVTSDPYFSIWSEADHLTDDATRHWTHHEHSLSSLIRVDGKAFRLMGNNPKDIPAFPQVSVQVTPTRSIYEFEDTGVHVQLTFMTPALPDDLEVLARPVTYLTWSVHSVDGSKHKVQIYDSTSSQLVVNQEQEQVTWAREQAGDLTLLKVGTEEQPVLRSSGDDHRINWGYAYVAAPAAQSKSSMGSGETMARSFARNGDLPDEDIKKMPRAVHDQQPALAFVFNLGEVAAKPIMRQVMIAYDEVYSIKYFGQKLQPYWRRNGATPASLFQVAAKDYPKLSKRCAEFDEQLTADLTKVGGSRYAQICALAYRQCLAACGLAADANKQPLFFTKENTSNGDIATVDVFYPMDPVLILLSPTLAKASVVPILSYAASWHWKFPNAPHDLGTYPNARGTDDGGEGMPVEESGNMLLLCDAIAQSEGNADFVTPWWPQLTQWAQYLEQYGLDPENQLCTDDFMGHLAHNANLSVKAILGLAAYGDLCRMRGDLVNAEKYAKLAKTDAAHWMQAAAEGDHYRLAFDKPNTWSQKYNLAWDRILGLNVFPREVAQKEVSYYKKVMQRYGVPLDSRTHLTKTDWSVWSATLADNQEDFETIISPIYDYLNQTSARSPLADSYITDDIKSDGMHARPVVGGLFIKMLSDKGMWKKWASRDHLKVGNWAALPEPPQIKEVVSTSEKNPVLWRYTTQKPPTGWTEPDFNTTNWKEGAAGFGTNPPGAVIRTQWNSDDIWIRREFTMPTESSGNLQFLVYHDEDVEIYVNGVLAAREQGFNTGYEPFEIIPQALSLLKPGAKITLAAHCHQTTGGQNIDIGIVSVMEADKRLSKAQ
ncbi:glutaminase family protein [Pedosphaera parvula]|uniref:Glutaminase n=1 Tax=Pedosphaera parvula (strain Ellin514) TaxID=320771 RepID=B9XAZ7_PEDPL|nr:glutaminase family protein [Pedosphaera parvula]EEF63182.1 protein of unknown function DUF1793 [Pedosphaera parvula Ellin514]